MHIRTSYFIFFSFIYCTVLCTYAHTELFFVFCFYCHSTCCCVRPYVLPQYLHILSDAIRPISFHHLLVFSYEHKLTTTIVELIYVSPGKTPVHQQLQLTIGLAKGKGVYNEIHNKVIISGRETTKNKKGKRKKACFFDCNTEGSPYDGNLQPDCGKTC